MILLVLKNQPNRSCANRGRKSVARLACHRSTFSRFGASDKPGAVHSNAFAPLYDYLEGRNRAPGDYIVSTSLESFDAEGVHAVWSKALDRRNADPEGAITIARTLLETVCKRILDQIPGSSYTDKEDLPKLYGMVARALSLAPDQHSEESIKAILGGAMTLVNGIGTLRNRLSNSHGRGGKPVRPSPRHASLAVNLAGGVATFLVETFLARQESKGP